MTNFSLFTIVQISIAAVFEIFSKILHGPNNISTLSASEIARP